MGQLIFNTAGADQIEIGVSTPSAVNIFGTLYTQYWQAGAGGAGLVAENGGGGGGGFCFGKITGLSQGDLIDIVVASGGGEDTQAGAGSIIQDAFVWVTDSTVALPGESEVGGSGGIPTSQLESGAEAEGGIGGYDGGISTSGGGGGSSASGVIGEAAEDGNEGNTPTGGVAPTGGGDGGDGGLISLDGNDGISPGGGGGGGGDGATTAGLGADGKIIFSWLNPPVITSNGGGSTGTPNPILVTEGTTAVTTCVATGNDVLYELYDEATYPDNQFFTLDNGSGELTFTNPPNFDTPADFDNDNIYDIAFAAIDIDPTGELHSRDIQILHVRVTEESVTGRAGALGTRLQNMNLICGLSL